MKKNKLYLNDTEWRFLIHSLNTLKTKLIGRSYRIPKIHVIDYLAIADEKN